MIRFDVRCSQHKEGKYEVYCYIGGVIFYSTSWYDKEDAKRLCSQLNDVMNEDQEELYRLNKALEAITLIIKGATGD